MPNLNIFIFEIHLKWKHNRINMSKDKIESEIIQGDLILFTFYEHQLQLIFQFSIWYKLIGLIFIIIK